MGVLDAVALGDLNCDLILTDLERSPVTDQEVLAGAYKLTLGGSTAICAAVLNRIGSRVGFAGLVGDDSFGRRMRAFLEDYGVDTGGLLVDRFGQTGLTVSLMHGGNRALVTVSGTITGLTAEKIPWEYVRKAKHLHIGSFYLQTALRPSLSAVLERARGLGLTTSLDTGWDPAGKWDWPEVSALLPLVDIFLPNATEALHLTKSRNLYSALSKLLAAGPRVAAIKCGAKGAIAGQGDLRESSPPFKVQVVDTTGAGDSFDAGFIHRFIRGDNLADCLAFANACGAIGTMRVGGADDATPETEVREFMRSQRPNLA